MSTLTRLLGSLAVQDLNDMSSASARQPEKRDVLMAASGKVVSSLCGSLVKDIADKPFSEQRVDMIDTAIVSLLHYRDVALPVAAPVVEKFMELREAKNDQGISDYFDELLTYDDERHEKFGVALTVYENMLANELK